MNFGERLKKVRQNRGLTLLEVAERLNKTEATVQRYESGNIKNLKSDTILQLSSILNVSPAYLMGWNEDDQSNIIKESSATYNYYPEKISAGLPMHMKGITESNEIEVPNSVMGRWSGDKNIYMMRINGESMNKSIPDGSLIAVKPIDKFNLKEGDIVVYSVNGDYSVKQYYRDGNQIIFRPNSTDPRFYDYITSVENDDLTIHGKVVVYIVELD